MYGQERGAAPKRASARERELCLQPIALHVPWKEIAGSAAQPRHVAHQVSPVGMAFPGEVRSDVKWDGVRVLTANYWLLLRGGRSRGLCAGESEDFLLTCLG